MYDKLRKTIVLLVVFCVLLCAFVIGCANNTEKPENSNSTDNPIDGTDNSQNDPPNTDKEPDPTAHKHSLEYHIANNATCTADGNSEYWFCTKCKNSYSDECASQLITDVSIAATGHSYTETVIDPTCTHNGYTLHQCVNCTDEYTDNETSAIGHAWEQTEITTQPTCTVDGLCAIKCTNCGSESTRTLPANGHNYQETITPPTCTAEGSTLHVCCDCGDEYTDSYVEELGHSYYLDVTEPTCTDVGITVQKCHRCDIEIIDLKTVPALGHDWTEKVTPPTCTESGLIEKTCKTCGDVVTEVIPATDHDCTVETTLPTCTDKGYTKYTCKNCDYEYICDEVEATDHNYIESITQPTCTTGGFTSHTCANCGASYIDNETAATGHKYSDEWSSDETYHWHEVLCDCDIAVEKTAHTYINGVCECGQHEPLPYKFTFELDDDTYIVSGIQVADNVEDGSLELVIPGEYNGLPVTKIDNEAFRSNTKIKSITIPTSIKRIGKNAFLGCSVTSVIFKDTSGWKVSQKENGSQATTVSVTNATENAKQLTKNTATYKASYYWFCS